jgi:hypothetical protein
MTSAFLKLVKELRLAIVMIQYCATLVHASQQYSLLLVTVTGAICVEIC